MAFFPLRGLDHDEAAVGEHIEGAGLYDSTLVEQLIPQTPCVCTRFLVDFSGVRRFTCSHKAMPCAFIGHRCITFAGIFHEFFRLRYGCGHTGIITAIETIDRTFDSFERFLVTWLPTIEDESCCQRRLIRGKAKRLRAASAKSGDGYFSIAGRQFGDIIKACIQVFGHLLWA